jgi:hypothetical protein
LPSLSHKKLFIPAVQGIKHAHFQQANALVCGQKISSIMMAIPGKHYIGTYLTEPSFKNTRKYRKRAVVSLIKARTIFTNQTEKNKPHLTKTGEIYPSG